MPMWWVRSIITHILVMKGSSMNYKIYQNPSTGLYSVKIRFLHFFWSWLQNKHPDPMLRTNVECGTYEEAEKLAIVFLKKDTKPKWVDVTKTNEDTTGGYRGGDSKGKRGIPPTKM